MMRVFPNRVSPIASATAGFLLGAMYVILMLQLLPLI